MSKLERIVHDDSNGLDYIGLNMQTEDAVILQTAEKICWIG